MVDTGCVPTIGSSCPSRYWGASFAASDDRAFRALLRPLFRKKWVVYAKPPFGGPEHVLQYLARYTHRVAISNHRIVNVADEPSHFAGKTTPTAGSRRS